MTGCSKVLSPAAAHLLAPENCLLRRWTEIVRCELERHELEKREAREEEGLWLQRQRWQN